MKCRQCGSKISEEFVACPYCGIRLDSADASAVQASASNDSGVKEALKQLIETFGIEILSDNKKLISLLSDYIPEYEKERRLIKTVVNNDVFKTLLEGSGDQKLAVTKSREYMIKELFISENAAEFILECFTYALGWSYEPVVNYGTSYGYKEEGAASAPKKKASSVVSKSEPAPAAKDEPELPKKEFTSFDALKYRFRGRANIPYGFTAIESFAFDSYKWLRVVKIPDSVSVIGEYAFSECKRIKTVMLPTSLRVIKKSAFSSCERLLSINIPMGVSSIEDSAFSFCQKITSIALPNTVSNIGSEAFSGCENLSKMRIPDSVKFIGERAFEFCPKLTIECVNGSYVHKYCRANKLNFTTYEAE